ncbi:MAG: chemotaxis protein CheW [Leptothrix sp. (in: b-proteobacteria)]
MQVLAIAAAPETNPTQQFLRFVLGTEMYAVRIDLVREILEVVQMTPLPLMPPFVRGVMNLRGAVVPVIDLGARLGLPVTRIGRRTCVVIVDVHRHDDDGVQTIGVLVDAVHEVFDLPATDMEPVPRLGTRIDPGLIRSMVRVRGRTTPELDLGAILEQQQLAQLISQHSATH